MGMRLQLLREGRISSRGRGLHKPKVEPRRKRLTSGHMTQAETQRKAHQRQADRQEIAFWRTGHIPPNTHTHTHTHTSTDRERARNTQRVGDRERRDNGRHTNTYTHGDRQTAGAQKQTPPGGP
ncbi:hypothetical protein H8958_013342, partial [Nasalis larvatus]